MLNKPVDSTTTRSELKFGIGLHSAGGVESPGAFSGRFGIGIHPLIEEWSSVPDSKNCISPGAQASGCAVTHSSRWRHQNVGTKCGHPKCARITVPFFGAADGSSNREPGIAPQSPLGVSGGRPVPSRAERYSESVIFVWGCVDLIVRQTILLPEFLGFFQSCRVGRSPFGRMPL